MLKKSKIISALLAILVAMLACANPLTSPVQPANVETIVASTLSALTAPAIQATPPSSSNLLLHSLYYLSYDDANLLQVFRLEKDGVTISQLTFEPSDVAE